MLAIMGRRHLKLLLGISAAVALCFLLTSAPFAVHASALSAGTISSSSGASVTVGATTTIQTSGASGGSGGYTYQWTNLPDGCATANSPAISCTPTDTTGSPFTLTLTVTDSSSDTAQATLSLTVAKAAPTFYSVNCPTPDVGYTATCTATLSSAYQPGGTVTFTQTSSAMLISPSTFDCTVSPTTDSCTTPTTSTTGAGTVTFSVAYSGDPNNSPAMTTATLQIAKAVSTMTANCASSTVVIGEQTTCTAVLGGTFSPSGAIAWSFTGTGTFTPTSCTVPPVSCSVSFSPATSGTITATYPGDGNNDGSYKSFDLAADIGDSITITVANGGPSAVIDLSGCSVSPTTISANGVAWTFQAASGCSALALTLPPAGADARYLSANGTGSLAIPTCTSSPCQPFSATIYYQFQNTYRVIPESPSTWAASGSVPVTGTALGNASARVCTITITTGTGGFSCQGWSDYGTQVVMGSLSLSSTQREAASPPAFTDTSAGGTDYDSSYYLQVLEGFQYSLVGGTTAPSAPGISYTALGAPATSPLTGSAASLSIWMDSGSSWNVPQTISGSTTTERWYSPVTSGAATGGATISLAYYHQYFVTFGYSVIGGGTVYIPPSEQFQESGNQTTGSQGWADAGSSYSFTNPLAGSTAGERWFSQEATGAVTSAGPINATYYRQYTLTLSFTVSGGGSYDSPLLSSTSFAAPASAQLSAAPTVLWVDSGAKWSVSTLLPSSTDTERWITQQTDSGTATSAVVLQLKYYHQYAGSFSYSIKGSGGSPPVPKLNYTEFGSSVLVPLSSSPTVVWPDSGSAWTAQPTIPGEQGERWLSNATALTPVDSGFSADIQYSHQFYVEVGLNTAAGGQVANADQWEYQGNSVMLNATSAHQWTFAYWQGGTTYSYNGTTRSPSLTVTGPANETAVFYPGLNISTDSDGSVAYSYGTVSGVVPAGSNATIYPPLDKNVTLTAMPKTVEIMFQGWTGVLKGSQLQSSVAIVTPGSALATFATDYTDIRTFTLATLFVFLLAAYVLVIRRGFAPKVPKIPGIG
jgi:hypothetical protein